MADVSDIGMLMAWNESMLAPASYNSMSSTAKSWTRSVVERNREWIAQHQLALQIKSKYVIEEGTDD